MAEESSAPVSSTHVEDRSIVARLFSPDEGSCSLWPRWIFLRGLGLVYLSAFVSLHFQIDGLIGPNGILPAGRYLEAIASALPRARHWYAPTLLWLSSSHTALSFLVWCGIVASVALVLGFWPRLTLAACFVSFLSFVTATDVFSSYQSDGMLLEAGFLALFFAPSGIRPGLGHRHPPSRASLFLLQWEWFRIYFESGVVKLLSGDVQWRTLTSMDHYYENGPLPTWIGWYVQKAPHSFHASTAAFTLVVELVVVWLLFVRRWPRSSPSAAHLALTQESPGPPDTEEVTRPATDRARGRLARQICFWIVTPMQISIILTANYAFLNYIVLLLGVLLLDDRFFERFRLPGIHPTEVRHSSRPQYVFQAVVLSWIFWATVTGFLYRSPTNVPYFVLQPFRVANSYGLFAVMTRARYEIEFQGSVDGGATWVGYPFRFKPQDPKEAPGIYAPYQPRFEWNLWFAALSSWQSQQWVINVEERLLDGEPSVLALFRRDPFDGNLPQQVRAVLWQYWFSDLETKRATGAWWRREYLGEYAPTLGRDESGSLVVVRIPVLPNIQR